MVWEKPIEPEDKAGYNQAAKITEILAMLRVTFTSSMLEEPNNFDSALECCRSITNIISAKVNDDQIEEINSKVYVIEDRLPKAKQTYLHEGARYFRDPEERKEIKRDLEGLWRELEKLQDEYGYGMFSEEESGL